MSAESLRTDRKTAFPEHPSLLHTLPLLMFEYDRSVIDLAFLGSSHFVSDFRIDPLGQIFSAVPDKVVSPALVPYG